MEKYSFYVMSSRYEGFGLVLAEAQAKGLPVISFDCVAGPKEIINDGKDGILVETENAEKLAEAIIKMSENIEMRIEMSRNAVKNAERFAINNIGEQWRNLFKNLLRED